MQAESLQPGAGLFESIIESPQDVLVLHTEQRALLVDQFRTLARRNGQAVYLWRRESGLTSLREGGVRVPGCERMIDTLRHALHSLHFGVYFIDHQDRALKATEVALLGQIAHTPAEHVRRIVLFSGDPAVVEVLDGARLLSAFGAAAARPRLRDGRWVT